MLYYFFKNMLPYSIVIKNNVILTCNVTMCMQLQYY